jgi:hypothetical protein
MAGRGVINGSSARVSGSYRNGRLDLGQDFGGTPHIRWSPPRSPKAGGLPGAMACQPQRCGIQLLVLADRRWLTVAWHMLQTIKREKVDIGNHGSSPRASMACIPAEATCIFPMVLRFRYGACGQYLSPSKGKGDWGELAQRRHVKRPSDLTAAAADRSEAPSLQGQG